MSFVLKKFLYFLKNDANNDILNKNIGYNLSLLGAARLVPAGSASVQNVDPARAVGWVQVT